MQNTVEKRQEALENFESEINSIAGVKECLVYSVVKNGRTTINVKVVIEANQEVYIINGVKEIANKMHLSSKLREIEVVENELPKNKLGKIIRKAN